MIGVCTSLPICFQPLLWPSYYLVYFFFWFLVFYYFMNVISFHCNKHIEIAWLTDTIVNAPRAKIALTIFFNSILIFWKLNLVVIFSTSYTVFKLKQSFVLICLERPVLQKKLCSRAQKLLNAFLLSRLLFRVLQVAYTLTSGRDQVQCWKNKVRTCEMLTQSHKDT